MRIPTHAAALCIVLILFFFNGAAFACQVISSPGTYYLAGNASGANNSASPLAGTACIKITSSNVVFDCNGYSVMNNGTPATTYGILLNGSQVNVTVRNCQVADYNNGIYLRNSNQSNLINNTIFSATYNTTDSGVYLYSSSSNNISGNTVYRRGYGYYITTGANNNTFSGNSANNASNGFYLASNSDNNKFTGNVAGNSTNGFYENSGCDYSSFSANNASNTSYAFRISGQGNNLSGNYVNRSNYGVYLSSSGGNTLTNNNVSYGQTSFYLSTSNNNNLSGNWAYNGTSYGILFFQSSGCNLTGNYVYHNGQYGILVDQSSNNNFLGGNYAYNNSRDGITVASSKNNVFSGNFAHMNNWSGLSSIASGTNNTFSGGASYSNRRYGIYVQYANTTFSSITLYNNSNAISIDGAPYTVLNFSDILLTNPYGTLENYTNLSFYDATTSGEDYIVDWAANSSALPSERSSFAGKFVNISRVTGTVSIDRITWRWGSSELSGYNESKFELWKYNSSGWAMLNDTPDTSNHLISLYNLNPASDYGILQNDHVDMTVYLNSPGNGVNLLNNTVNFNCSAVSNATLQNITLYGDWGGWHANETAALSGGSDSHVFTKTLPNGTYSWNCLGFDSANNSDWGDSNYTFTINANASPAGLSGANVTVISTSKWGSNITAGNFTTEGGNITQVDLNTSASTEKWAGVHGNVSANLLLSESNVTTYMYLWIWNASSGGEVCTTQNPLPDWAQLAITDKGAIDSAFGFLPVSADSANNTLTDASADFEINGLSLSTTGTQIQGYSTFVSGALSISANATSESDFLFCSNITNGRNYANQSVNFEIMMPTTSAAGPGPFEAYYFFLELS